MLWKKESGRKGGCDPTATILQRDGEWWHSPRTFLLLCDDLTRFPSGSLSTLLEPQLNLMWPQWHSEPWVMRQCPELATTVANQRWSQICPTCCGPKWLTPRGTTHAHSIRGETNCCRRSKGLVTGLTRVVFSPFLFCRQNLSEIFLPTVLLKTMASSN